MIFFPSPALYCMIRDRMLGWMVSVLDPPVFSFAPKKIHLFIKCRKHILGGYWTFSWTWSDILNESVTMTFLKWLLVGFLLPAGQPPAPTPPPLSHGQTAALGGKKQDTNRFWGSFFCPFSCCTIGVPAEAKHPAPFYLPAFAHLLFFSSA